LAGLVVVSSFRRFVVSSFRRFVVSSFRSDEETKRRKDKLFSAVIPGAIRDLTDQASFLDRARRRGDKRSASTTLCLKRWMRFPLIHPTKITLCLAKAGRREVGWSVGRFLFTANLSAKTRRHGVIRRG